MLGYKRGTGDRSKRKKTIGFFTKPSVYHALIVIFLEFFAFGLLTAPMISVLNEAFPRHTFLMNGLIQGVKGFLSFLSAPFIGSLSDVFGRKPFLLLTVTLTCSPIPLMNVSHWWYFTMVTMSGIFAVTFSVVFAYVADITSEEDRSWTYGLVSATFAASLVTSPAIGAYLGKVYSENFVIALASAVALLDIFFILACVPESLPEKCRPGAWGTRIPWEKADPFRSLKRLSDDHLIMMLCIATFLSYLPEAGEYSCFFVYLRLVMGFSEEAVALFIAVVGITSCLAQTVFLSALITHLDPKRAIIVGLGFEVFQLTIYGLASDQRLLWFAGIMAGMGSITYPAISAFVSNHAEKDQQGVTQGVLTGIRGLCNGMGPALYGLIFYIFNVDLTKQHSVAPFPSIAPTISTIKMNISDPVLITRLHEFHELFMPGPPFAFGAVLVFLAILVTFIIPENPREPFSITVRPLPLPHRHHENAFTQVKQESDTEEVLSQPSERQHSLHRHHKLSHETVYLHELSEKTSESKRNPSTHSVTATNKEKTSRPSSVADTYINSTSAAGRRFLHFWLRWRHERRIDSRDSLTTSTSLVNNESNSGLQHSSATTSHYIPSQQSGNLYRAPSSSLAVNPIKDSMIPPKASIRRPLLAVDYGGTTSSDEDNDPALRGTRGIERDKYFSLATSIPSDELFMASELDRSGSISSRFILGGNSSSSTVQPVNHHYHASSTTFAGASNSFSANPNKLASE